MVKKNLYFWHSETFRTQWWRPTSLQLGTFVDIWLCTGLLLSSFSQECIFFFAQHEPTPKLLVRTGICFFLEGMSRRRGAIRCKGVECESRNEIKFSRLFFGLMTGVWNWRLLSLLLLFLLLMVYAVEVFWWEWKIKNPFLLSLSFLNFLSCILSSIRTQKTAS